MDVTYLNNRRIVKNTIFLYARMVFNMGISLYTSRIILNTLGVEDFGIYSVVGGVVLMFAFLNNALTAAVQRFISFELGRGFSNRLQRVFCMSVNIYVVLAIMITILCETVGLYVLYYYLKIPEERMDAAFVVFQCSLISFVISILQVPFMSSIIAHEKMSVFAVGSVVETLAKFLGVVVLSYWAVDKLEAYAWILLLIAMAMAVFYRYYALKKFQECRYKRMWDSGLAKEMLGYSSWSLFGGIAVVASSYGINILLNIFFGPVVNTARGIAYQVNTAITSLYSSFLQAVNPQIVKQYSSGNFRYMQQLVYGSCRLTYLLVLLLGIPVCLETEKIFYLWLGQVPEYTVVFCRLVLIATLADCVSMPLVAAVNATGKIKKYQAFVGTVLFLNLPLSYIVLKITGIPQYSFYVAIFVAFCTALVRLWFAKKLLSLSVYYFFKEVVYRVTLVTLFSCISFLLPYYMPDNAGGFCVSMMGGLIITGGSIWCWGMTPGEKQMVLDKINKRKQ